MYRQISGILLLAFLSPPLVAVGQPVRSARQWAPPRTPWGDPDIQGTYTTNDELGIPFERPSRFAGRTATDLTAQELADSIEERQRASQAVGPFGVPTPAHWAEGTERRNSRAWLIVDPADGKIPSLTTQALEQRTARAAAQAQGGPNGNLRSYEDLGRAERCVALNVALAMRPGASGNFYEIVQAPGVVAIRYEQMHETRIVRLGSSRHVGSEIRSYSGDPLGHWEGNDLVVETTNLTEKGYAGYPGIRPETLRMIERFSPVAESHMELTVTYEDATMWTRPWSWAIRLTKDDKQHIFEYACHEGNLSLRNVLSAARATVQAGKESTGGSLSPTQK
jgi:hypothetical protein